MEWFYTLSHIFGQDKWAPVEISLLARVNWWGLIGSGILNKQRNDGILLLIVFCWKMVDFDVSFMLQCDELDGRYLEKVKLGAFHFQDKIYLLATIHNQRMRILD